MPRNIKLTRKLEAQEIRVETGPTQFGDDWPGLFIRGDNAFEFAVKLRNYLEDPQNNSAKLALKHLISLLESTQL